MLPSLLHGIRCALKREGKAPRPTTLKPPSDGIQPTPGLPGTATRQNQPWSFSDDGSLHGHGFQKSPGVPDWIRPLFWFRSGYSSTHFLRVENWLHPTGSRPTCTGGYWRIQPPAPGKKAPCHRLPTILARIALMRVNMKVTVITERPFHFWKKMLAYAPKPTPHTYFTRCSSFFKA